MSEATAELTPWKYTGFEQSTGARRRGRIMAPSEMEALFAVRQLGVVGAEVRQLRAKTGRRSLSAATKTGSVSERLNFLRSLALINSAVGSLADSLEIAAQQVKKSSPLRPAIDELLEAATRGGDTLDRAFARQSHIWGDEVAAVISAGIESSELTESLKTLVLHKQRSARIRKKVRKALTQPILSLVLTVAVVWYGLFRVIPASLEFGAEVDVGVPAATQFALSVRDFLSVWGLPAVVLVLVGGVALFFGSQSEKYGEEVAAFLLRVPVLGRVLHMQSMSLAAGVIAIGLTAGSDFWQVVEWAGQSTPNRRVKRAFQDAYGRMMTGGSFAEAIEEQVPILPLEVSVLARQSEFALDESGPQWRVYVDELSEATEEKVETFSNAVITLAGVGLMVVVTFVFYAATAPMFEILLKITQNPGGGGTNIGG